MGQKVSGRRRRFILQKKSPTGSRVLTAGVKLRLQQLYADGHSLSDICAQLSIKLNTVQKAIRSGRLLLISPASSAGVEPTSKSIRSGCDNSTGMGKACHNTLGRVLASRTGQSATPQFDSHIDLSHAGVLISLPALLSNGLLSGHEAFKPDTGYYSVESVLLCLAFIALLRVKVLGQVDKVPAGELGKAMGLDRIPEVKLLRKRIAAFCSKTAVREWSASLSEQWMQQDPAMAGVLYVDGHVNIYHGHQTRMPRRYVSRLRLCMSGSTDYWVNDAIGQPFFVLNEPIAGGMIDKLRKEIIPRLNDEVPGQPTAADLAANGLLCRYMVVFDREGYSPELFFDLWQQRIAVCTYNKNVKDIWAEEEFAAYEVVMPGGNVQKMELAERGVLLEVKGNDKKIWCREVRKLRPGGNQTSILTTQYMLPLTLVGAYMFARWSQENFFKYMMKHFDIDALVSYAKEKIDATKQLVNPAWRALDSQLRKLNSQLNRIKVKFAGHTLARKDIEENKMLKYLDKKSQLLDQIHRLEEQINTIKDKKKTVDRKITYSQLPEPERFSNAINDRKHFADTIKMIAYRGETAMCNLIRKDMGHPNEARKLMRRIYMSDADIQPNYDNKTLTVSLHRLNHWRDDKVMGKLCEQMNQTQTRFPGTDLTIKYKLVAADNP